MLCLSLAVFLIPVPLSFPSNTRTDSKCSNLKESANQSPGTSRSSLLLPSARSPSTLVSVGNTLGLSSGVVASGPSSNVYHNAVILSQKQASSTSPPTYKKQHVSSSSVKQTSMPVHDRSGTLSYTHFPQEILIQPSIILPSSGTDVCRRNNGRRRYVSSPYR